MKRCVLLVPLLLVCLLSVKLCRAQTPNGDVYTLESSKPLIRGGIAFRNYCALCHGEKGDGMARAAKLYEGLDLSIKRKPAEYYERIILRGGRAVGMSPYMPPWKNELSREQVSDIVAYLEVVANPVRRGEVVFKTNCVLCHGLQADGQGRAARLFDPPPANLRRTSRSEQYKEQIVRRGGQAMGRSSAMPNWDDKLSETEIADLLVYLRSITDAQQ